MKENWTYRRGDIYLANLNPYIGSEQGGTRPVLLLQNNTGNFYCPTLIVAPLTARRGKKPHQPTHYLLSSVKGICGARYIARSGRSKYCTDCAAEVHRKQKAAYARKKRSSVDN